MVWKCEWWSNIGSYKYESVIMKDTFAKKEWEEYELEITWTEIQIKALGHRKYSYTLQFSCFFAHRLNINLLWMNTNLWLRVNYNESKHFDWETVLFSLQFVLVSKYGWKNLLILKHLTL